MTIERKEPRWVTTEIAMAVHDRQIAEHGGGGGGGVRDAGLVESAITRPENKWSYGEDDLAVMAAAYAYGIARNHPFVDVKKRTAWVAARLFLALNDVAVRFDKQDATQTVLALAAGELGEEELTDWFRASIEAAA